MTKGTEDKECDDLQHCKETSPPHIHQSALLFICSSFRSVKCSAVIIIKEAIYPQKWITAPVLRVWTQARQTESQDMKTFWNSKEKKNISWLIFQLFRKKQVPCCWLCNLFILSIRRFISKKNRETAIMKLLLLPRVSHAVRLVYCITAVTVWIQTIEVCFQLSRGDMHAPGAPLFNSIIYLVHSATLPTVIYVLTRWKISYFLIRLENVNDFHTQK